MQVDIPTCGASEYEALAASVGGNKSSRWVGQPSLESVPIFFQPPHSLKFSFEGAGEGATNTQVP